MASEILDWHKAPLQGMGAQKPREEQEPRLVSPVGEQLEMARGVARHGEGQGDKAGSV